MSIGIKPYYPFLERVSFATVQRYLLNRGWEKRESKR